MVTRFRQAQRVQTAPSYQNTRRKLRRPQHTFNIRQRPFVLQPFFIAPVLPGETLKNLLLQARVVTDPLASPLIGWWQEYYFFYVKVTDLDEREALQEMFVKNSALPASMVRGSASNAFYSFNGSTDWTRHCLKRVVEEYFRNEGENWDQFVIDGLPVASVNREDFTNSLIAASSLSDDDIDVDLDNDSNITASEVDEAMRQWQLLHDMQLTDMTYEDFLRTFGVRSQRVQSNVPELVRYVRNWTYPSNTVNPADGSVASAASWSINERADKDRFFREPGFLFGITTTRAKVYFANLTGSGTGALQEMMDWWPATLHDDDRATMKQFDELKGPLPTFNTADNEGYVFDLRDLLIYGDQYTNFDRGAVTDANLVGLPTATGQRRYLDGTEVDKLFKTPASGKLVRQDGLVSLNIAGRQEDRTPGLPAVNI